MNERATIAATHMGSDRDFYIGPGADEEDRELTEWLYGRITGQAKPGREMVECREHDEDPTLRHLRSDDGLVHGIWIYLRKLDEGTPNERWVITHFDGRASHVVHLSKSKQHQREQDAWQEAASRIGYESLQEHWLGGVRCDLLIRGTAADIDVEVQRTYIKRAAAQERTRKALASGAHSIWSTDHITDWSQKNSVPHIRTNELPEGHSVPDTWVVVGGLRDVAAKRCSFEFFDKCPATGRGYSCGKSHPLLTPKYGVRVYDVVEQAPAGALVKLETGRSQGTVLVTPEHRDLWAELVQESGLAKPPRVKPQGHRKALHRQRLREDFAETVERHQSEMVADLPEPRRPPAEAQRCIGCDEDKYGLAEGFCLSCRLLGRHKH